MFSRTRLLIRTMSSFANIPVVDIDPSGVFKYILIKMISKEEDKSVHEFVRGYADCGYHADIEDKFTEELNKLLERAEIRKWRKKVAGGGRIDINPDEKTINVYGYSQQFGRGDHQCAVNLLKTVYKDYNITWSNEGY